MGTIVIGLLMFLYLGVVIALLATVGTDDRPYAGVSVLAVGIFWAIAYAFATADNAATEWIGSVAGGAAGALVGGAAGMFAFLGAGAFTFVTARVAGRSQGHGKAGAFALLWTAIALLFVLVSPLGIAGFGVWFAIGPMLMFLALLTLVNAPFDWITLGLTRTLLRRGLERGGWWPLVYGIVDLLAAALVVMALSVAVLWAVQLFGHFTARGGGAQVLDPQRVLDALADPARRAAPEYWWLYAMLFSTLIPSIVNVALGALSLLRGIPGAHARLARRMPDGEAVIESERMWMAPLLAGQAMLSVVIGTAVMLGLLWLILVWELPLMGWNLVSMLQALAAADLPGRLLGLLGIG
jgi:hypothetical protein